MANIVPVTISDALFYKTDPVFQYNEGDQLLVIDGITLPASYRVDFSNHIDNYMAYTVTGDADGAVIPPEILANGNTIYAFYVDESGDTVTTQYRIEIPVIRRPMPEDYVPSPSSHGIINQLTQDVGDLKSDLGDLNDLETTAKNNLVAAINEAAQSGGGGALTQDTKQALLACFEHVAWIDGHGQDYYDALETALYPPASLVGITATYTQSGEVYDNQTLDSLKPDLVVMATYDNGTSEAVTTYTLSGTLATGTSTITVTYGGKTATFTVVVTHATTQYTVTNTLTNCSNSNSATVANENSAYSGTLTADTDYVMGTVAITMGGTDITSTAYNSGTGAISIASVTGDIVITATATAPPVTLSDVSYPITLTWNPSNNTYNLSESLGEQGKQYRVEVDVDSISSPNAYIMASATGSGGTNTAFVYFNGDNIGKTGTLSAIATLSNFTAGAWQIKLSCNKGTESSNQTAVVSGFRIYEV